MANKVTEKEWWDDADVANWLGMSRSAIRSHRSRGHGPLAEASPSNPGGLAKRIGPRSVRYHGPTLREQLTGAS